MFVRLLDLGFEKPVSEIVGVMDEAGRRQTVLVSATLTAGKMSYLDYFEGQMYCLDLFSKVQHMVAPP